MLWDHQGPLLEGDVPEGLPSAPGSGHPTAGRWVLVTWAETPCMGRWETPGVRERGRHTTKTEKPGLSEGAKVPSGPRRALWRGGRMSLHPSCEARAQGGRASQSGPKDKGAFELPEQRRHNSVVWGLSSPPKTEQGGLGCHLSQAPRITPPTRTATATQGAGSGRPGLRLAGCGESPGGHRSVPWLFQARSAPLDTPAPREARSPFSAPQGSIRINLDRLSARRARLESESHC